MAQSKSKEWKIYKQGSGGSDEGNIKLKPKSFLQR